MPTTTTDIAIIGGGLAGLTAALMLATTGHTLTLVAPPRRPDGRTTALLGGSVAALRQLGLWDALAAGAAPLRAIRLIDGAQRLVRAPEVLFTAAEIGADAFGYNVANEPLLAALEAALPPAGIHRIDATADTIAPAEDAIRIIAGRAEIHARLVVGADGRDSAVRAAAGIAVTRRAYKQAALVTSFAHSAPHGDISTEFHTEHGPFTLVPLLGQRSALVWVTAPDEAARLKALDPAALGAAIWRRSEAILGAVTVDAPAQIFPLGLALADRYSAPRIALIGEAAHAIPPIAAQGFNLTVHDIAALAALITGAADPGAADLMTAYDRRRRSDTRRRATAVDMLNRSLLSGFLPVHALRGAGLFALATLRPLRRLLMRQGLGTP